MAKVNASVSLYFLTLGRAPALPFAPACGIPKDSHVYGRIIQRR